MRLDRPHLLDYLCTVELILVDFIDYALNHTLRSAFSNGQLVISLFITFCKQTPQINELDVPTKIGFLQQMFVDHSI